MLPHYLQFWLPTDDLYSTVVMKGIIRIELSLLDPFAWHF